MENLELLMQDGGFGLMTSKAFELSPPGLRIFDFNEKIGFSAWVVVEALNL
jgi:hypothetical protein